MSVCQSSMPVEVKHLQAVLVPNRQQDADTALGNTENDSLQLP